MTDYKGLEHIYSHKRGNSVEICNMSVANNREGENLKVKEKGDHHVK